MQTNSKCKISTILTERYTINHKQEYIEIQKREQQEEKEKQREPNLPSKNRQSCCPGTGNPTHLKPESQKPCACNAQPHRDTVIAPHNCKVQRQKNTLSLKPSRPQTLIHPHVLSQTHPIPPAPPRHAPTRNYSLTLAHPNPTLCTTIE